MFKNPRKYSESHALSFTDQPELSELFEALADGATPVTFVVGAGFSMNAGLPSWGQLLERIIDQFPNESFGRLARLDGDPITRKAEYLIRMAQMGANADDEATIVRKALYSRKPRPGPLHQAFANLCEKLGPRARVITTNFDPLIETAMANRGMATKSYFIDPAPETDPADQFTTWEDEASRPGDVLHVHGLLEYRKPLRSGIVLTESHFLRYGPRVRQLLTKRLEESLVVFLGVSLTDANLVGPLFDAPSRFAKPFVIAVPHQVRVEPDPAEPVDQTAFFLAKTASMIKALKLRAIVLKSHSQEVQLLWELSRAVDDLAAYRAGGNYGRQFANVLQSVYDRLGAELHDDFLPWDRAEELSRKLVDVLEGPTSEVAKIIGRQLQRDADNNITGEHLAIFLWLRVREPDPTKPHYAIRLTSTSTYVTRNEWTLVGAQSITNISEYAAVRAIFGGVTVVENVPLDRPSSTWKGNVAVPIRILRGSELYTVGAVTLTSTRLMETGAPPEETSFFLRLITDDAEDETDGADEAADEAAALLADLESSVAALLLPEA